MNRSIAVVSLVMLAVVLPVTPYRAHAQTGAGSIAGAWTLNTDLSDKPQQQTEADGGDRGGGSGRGGGRSGGGRGGRGGFGGGGFGGRGGPQASGASPEDRERMRQAVRDIMDAPSRLTITQTSSMVTIVTDDGRTTRLDPNGKGIKDESTKITRKTKWDNSKLVSEISGAGPGKITETYAIDPEHHRLTVTVQMENRGPQAKVMHRVYDAQPI